MRREYHRWHSPSLGRDMELLVFGHGGARVLAFPTSMGRFFEWEERGLVGALHEHLERGWVQVFCVDSVDAESWYARWAHPGHRAWRHLQYDAYLLRELLPFTRHLNANPYLIVTGASFGAYHAMNFALRHPSEVNRVIGLSGLYDIRRFVGGYHDGNVYFNNPVEFVPNEHEPARLEALRRLDIILATGRDDPNRASHDYFSGLLWARGIWHAVRLWDGWCHDWPYWRRMLPMYLAGPD